MGQREIDAGSQGETRRTTVERRPGMGLDHVLERNIEALQQRQRQDEVRGGVADRVARAITGFAGSISSVYVHLLVFGTWVILNLVEVPGIPQWDPTFTILAMVASVEAIFLTTFVLITQNRMSAAADRRAELDVQINLLAEHEITRLVTMVSAIALKLGVKTPIDNEVRDLEQDVAPDAVLDKMESKDDSK